MGEGRVVRDEREERSCRDSAVQEGEGAQVNVRQKLLLDGGEWVAGKSGHYPVCGPLGLIWRIWGRIQPPTHSGPERRDSELSALGGKGEGGKGGGVFRMESLEHPLAAGLEQQTHPADPAVVRRRYDAACTGGRTLGHWDAVMMGG